MSPKRLRSGVTSFFVLLKILSYRGLNHSHFVGMVKEKDGDGEVSGKIDLRLSCGKEAV